MQALTFFCTQKTRKFYWANFEKIMIFFTCMQKSEYLLVQNHSLMTEILYGQLFYNFTIVM